MKILVCRTDKAGDMILTSPVFKALSKQFENAEIYALASPYTTSILKMIPEVKGVIQNSSQGKQKGILELAAELKSHNFDKAIIVHPSFQSIMGTFLAGIPIRVGRASNIWQFFLSQRFVQKRSQNQKHEFEYNLDLAGENKNQSLFRPELHLSEKSVQSGLDYLLKAKMENTCPVIIHPGHGGSAHNLSPAQYSALANSLCEKSIPVVISFGPGEESLQSYFPEPQSQKIGYLKNLPDFESLAATFFHCSAFVGGSTGPMHLAGAIGLPVIAFFPPQKSMTPVRWGPANLPNKVLIPAVKDCQGKCSKCREAPCMSQLDPLAAVEWIQKLRKIK